MQQQPKYPTRISLDSAEMETAIHEGITHWLKLSARRRSLTTSDRDALFDHVVAAVHKANDKKGARP